MAAIRQNRLNFRAWLCVLAMVMTAVLIAVLFWPSIWALIGIAVLLACPIAAVWTYAMGQRPLPVPLDPAPETRGYTLNWIAPWYDILCSVFGLGRRFRDRTIAIASLQRGEHVLDVGCGTGVLTRLAADAVGPSGTVWGIDPAPDMIRSAMQSAGSAHNPARFKLAAIEALPFSDESFDVVLASLVMHHLPPELKALGLQEVYRVLKPGGRLVIVDIDLGGHGFWRLLLRPLVYHANMVDHFDRRMSCVLQGAGFESVTTGGQWGPLTFWSASKIVSMGSCGIAVGQKGKGEKQ